MKEKQSCCAVCCPAQLQAHPGEIQTPDNIDLGQGFAQKFSLPLAYNVGTGEGVEKGGGALTLQHMTRTTKLLTVASCCSGCIADDATGYTLCRLQIEPIWYRRLTRSRKAVEEIGGELNMSSGSISPKCDRILCVILQAGHTNKHEIPFNKLLRSIIIV